jgi:hypothetical protein
MLCFYSNQPFYFNLTNNNMAFLVNFDNLTLVHTKNDLGPWIKVILAGVTQTAGNAASTLQKIIELKRKLC